MTALEAAILSLLSCFSFFDLIRWLGSVWNVGCVRRGSRVEKPSFVMMERTDSNENCFTAATIDEDCVDRTFTFE